MRAKPIFLLLLAACTGAIPPSTDTPEGKPQPAPPATEPGASPSPAPSPLPPGDPNAAGPLPFMRLTRAQYDNTIRDLLGDNTRPAAAFPHDVAGPSGFLAPGRVGDVEARRFLEAAETVAASASKRWATLVPCDPARTGEEPCARTFIERFGRRAYRRPLEAAEITGLVDLYKSMRAAPVLHDHVNAVRVVLTAMLQSPKFLYRWELAPNAAALRDGPVVKLGPHEVASRLSYFLWSSMPDDALFAAADGGKLGTPADVEREARRLLADPRAKETIASFHDQWLELEALAETEKDRTAYPAWSPALRDAMGAELHAFVLHAALEDGKLSTLLEAPYSFVNEALAKLYDVPGVTGTQLRKATLGAGRAGLLTQGAFLAVQANTYESSPVKRGKLIRERMLCHVIPPPPPDVDSTPPKVDPKLQTREQYSAHSRDPSCAGCHSLMDPLGFAFESFDGIGRFRAMEAGRPVDTTGVITNVAGGERRFGNARELIATLAKLPEAQSCFTRQWARFAYGRADGASDAASLTAVQDAFARSNFDIRELLIALTKSCSFLHRSPTAGEVL